MDFKKIITDVDDKFKSPEFSTRATTINGDYGLYFRTTPFQVLASEGANKNKPLPGMTFVTGNQPTVWANQCISIFTSQEPKLDIIPKDSNLFADGNKSELLKNFWNTVYALANKESKKEGILPLHRSMAWTAVLTDYVIPRAIIDTSEKELIFDIKIADTASVCWAKGKRGRLKWIAYRFPRSKEEILEDYPGVNTTNVEENETHWWGYDDGKVTEVVFIAQEWVETINWSASMDSLPLSINPILLNPEARVNGVRQSSGASIYWGARDSFSELNRAMSVIATALMHESSPALIHNSTNADGSSGSDLSFYPTYGTVVEAHNTTESIKNVFTNTPTTVNVAETYKNDILKEIEQATAPEEAYGGQKYSHMATSLWEERTAQIGKILFPRRDAMESAYENIFYSIYDQFCKMEIELQVGLEKGEKKQTVESADLRALRGKFEVKFEVTAMEPSGDMMTFQKAQAATAAGVDPDFVDEKIMQYPDISQVRENRIKRQTLALMPEKTLFDYYGLACKEYDAMGAGKLKTMKLQEIEFVEDYIVELKKKLVNGGQDAQPK